MTRKQIQNRKRYIRDKVKMNARSKKYYEEHKEEIKKQQANRRKKLRGTLRFKHSNRNSFLKSKFGITLKDFNKLLESQKGKCAICLKPKDQLVHYKAKQKFGVDHNHLTGQIRGLLCRNCNLGIGNFIESIQILKNAIKYLKLWQKRK